jgi:starvation-inducible DNA-binding protein
MATAKEATALRVARLDTPTDLRPDAVPEISGALNILLADMFALYLKTKNFHWHMSGPDHAAVDRPHRPVAARAR